MAKHRIEIPLDKGLWTKKSSNELPQGALVYARDAVYRAGDESLRKRALHQTLGSGNTGTGHGITQFQTTDGATDKLVLHSGEKIYVADTSESPVFAATSTTSTNDDGNSRADSGPMTTVHYDNRLYISDGTSPVVVMDSDGDVDRVAGLEQPEQIDIELTTSGTGNIDITNGYHFTYRLYDSVNNVYSDPPTDAKGNVYYVSILGTVTDKLFIEVSNIETQGIDGSNADRLVLLMTQDEVNPTTFYPVKEINLDTDQSGANSGLNVNPNANAKTGTYPFSSPEKAYDESYDSASMGESTANASSFKGEVAHRWDFPATSSNAWEMVVTWRFSGFAKGPNSVMKKGAVDSVDAPFHLLLEYSINSGGAWSTTYEDTGTLYELAVATGLIPTVSTGFLGQWNANDVNTWTTTSTSIGTANSSTIQFRATIESTAVSTPTDSSGAVKVSSYNIERAQVHIADVRLIATGLGGGTNEGSFFIAEGDIPNGAEEPFINASNVGQYQPPPKRIFNNVIFEGHALGKSDDNGLFLAYSRTDEPEHWSTDPALSAFPYLIPFKEKEADDLVGAEKVANQLIVFAGDSVWRINHLPVLSDPNGSLESLFSEARNTVKRRVTDTVGCVGVRAYTRMQLSSDEDFVFFWSALGPMVTDGFRVWRAADHVDWDWLNADQSACVVTNNTAEQRIEVELRSSSASVNDVAYLFHYDPENLITQQGKGFRLKVLGPHPRTFADTAEIKKTDGTKEVVAIDSRSSNGSTYRLYAATSGTDALQAPQFNWQTGRMGKKGNENHFDRLIVNVDETGSRTQAIGDTTVTPDTPVDKPPLNIDTAGQSLTVEWSDDTVTHRIVQNDGTEQAAVVPKNETVSFSTDDRTINAVSLYFDDGEEITGR